MFIFLLSRIYSCKSLKKIWIPTSREIPLMYSEIFTGRYSPWKIQSNFAQTQYCLSCSYFWKFCNSLSTIRCKFQLRNICFRFFECLNQGAMCFITIELRRTDDKKNSSWRYKTLHYASIRQSFSVATAWFYCLLLMNNERVLLFFDIS